MMGLKLTNNARSILSAPITATETMVTVLVGHGQRFPSLPGEYEWFPLAIADEDGNFEICRAISRVGDAITAVRGRENTEARDWDAGAIVYLPLTTEAIYDLKAGDGIYASINDITVTDAP